MRHLHFPRATVDRAAAGDSSIDRPQKSHVPSLEFEPAEAYPAIRVTHRSFAERSCQRVASSYADRHRTKAMLRARRFRRRVASNARFRDPETVRPTAALGREAKYKLPTAVAFRCDRVHVAAHLVSKLASAREPPAEGLHEAVIALPPLGLSGGQCGVWQWRGARQPKAHEHRQRLVGNTDVAFDPLQMTRDTIKPARERGLKAIGAVGEGWLARVQDAFARQS